MYANLRAELVRKHMTISDLSELVQMPTQTIYTKTSGKSGFTLEEAVKIKKALEIDMPLEELFEQE